MEHITGTFFVSNFLALTKSWESNFWRRYCCGRWGLFLFGRWERYRQTTIFSVPWLQSHSSQVTELASTDKISRRYNLSRADQTCDDFKVQCVTYGWDWGWQKKSDESVDHPYNGFIIDHGNECFEVRLSNSQKVSCHRLLQLLNYMIAT